MLVAKRTLKTYVVEQRKWLKISILEGDLIYIKLMRLENDFKKTL